MILSSSSQMERLYFMDKILFHSIQQNDVVLDTPLWPVWMEGRVEGNRVELAKNKLILC